MWSYAPSAAVTALPSSGFATGVSTAASAPCPPPPAACKRRFEWDDEFFLLGNEERERGAKNFRGARGEIAKIMPLEAHGFVDTYVDEFECDIEGCHLVFSSLSVFDEHYLTSHTYKCEICSLRLPNNRLLEMHIQERHDEFFRCMAKTKRMFECLVEGCDQKFRSRKGRQLHLVDKHAYPPNYIYDRRQSRRVTTKGGRRQKAEKPQRVDVEMGDGGAAATPGSHSLQSSSASATLAPSSTASAPTAATPARSTIVSRSSILSFTPRSVRTNALAAKATPSRAVLAAAPAATSLLAMSSPAFTQMRDSASQAAFAAASVTSSSSAAGDSAMHDAVAQADKENMRNDDDDDDAPTAAGDDEMDIDAQVGLSRLNVKSATLPKKLTFGALHRRHA